MKTQVLVQLPRWITWIINHPGTYGMNDFFTQLSFLSLVSLSSKRISIIVPLALDEKSPTPKMTHSIESDP